MPLSDHEQRLLEQIERALYAEDPKFASTVRSTDLRFFYRRRVVRAGLLALVGVAVLVTGIVLGLTAVVAGGAIVVVAGGLLTLSSWRRLTSGDTRLRRRGRRPGPVARTGRQSIGERLEERWRRRFDERNF